MPPPWLGAVWAIAPLGRDHVATRGDDALSERVPLLGAIVQVAAGKWAGAPRSRDDLDRRCCAAVHLPTDAPLSPASAAEHGRKRRPNSALKPTVTNSVALTRSLACPRLNAIVRREASVCTAAVLLWARPRTAQQQARAAARAPAVPFESEPGTSGRLAADHHSATNSVTLGHHRRSGCDLARRWRTAQRTTPSAHGLSWA